MVKYVYGMYQAKPHDFSKKKATPATEIAKESNEHKKKHPSKWDSEMVELRFEEAIYTLKKLPAVKVQGYFSVWPNIVREGNEKIFEEKLQIKLKALPDEISRLDQVIEWSTWLEPHERKLVWKRAMGIRWKALCYEFGCDRSTVWRYYKLALTKISSRLNGG